MENARYKVVISDKSVNLYFSYELASIIYRNVIGAKLYIDKYNMGKWEEMEC